MASMASMASWASSTLSKPVLTLPVSIVQRDVKRRQKLQLRKKLMDKFDGDRSRPIIRCRRDELDHYFRQTYSK